MAQNLASGGRVDGDCVPYPLIRRSSILPDAGLLERNAWIEGAAARSTLSPNGT